MPILSRTSSSLMFSLQVVLAVTSILSAALVLKFSVPVITEFAVYEVPSIIKGTVSWFKPLYMYIVINCIIITIVAFSKFHSKNDDVTPPLPSEASPPLETAAHIQPQLQVMPVAENPQVVHSENEYKYDGVVLSSEAVPEGYANDVIDNNIGFARMEAKVLGNKTASFNGNADSFKDYVTSNKENEFVNSKLKDEPEYSSSNEKPRPPSVYARFGSRRNIKASPEGGKTVLGVLKPNKQDTLESTWNTITEGRATRLKRHLRKSDTRERDNHIHDHDHHLQPQQQEKTPKKMIKSDTFSDRANTSSPQLSPSSSGINKLKKEASLSQDELNRRVEAFIKKFNEEMRLQRQESLNQYMETINRASH
ncbi:uncharacterized protein LOC111394760 [Olea europaea var. sylvestris]|uniref:uncharacterized protein LOC111394760 n=1 Tax=Olea europaea var. sylvestris TaxID=158386 RepID=UPI000C1D8BF7|nr:uncharacterized protein LOC111394760 [Olea europaea var. sylvestris]